jgi:hypothetical protein
MITSHWSLLVMRNASEICRENKTSTTLHWTALSLNSCRLWDNVGKCCRAGQAAGNNTAHEHCMLGTKGTYTHSEYVILITSPQQQQLQKHVSPLRYTYTYTLHVHVTRTRTRYTYTYTLHVHVRVTRTRYTYALHVHVTRTRYTYALHVRVTRTRTRCTYT